ncbi:hypothetical protein B0H66DRAFT_522770 [Apodospora peruviana]|uniref:L-ornithine N(5)-oxygenase n=1 Tax=Apodospora peruviana TaxID=516989 RepID=A0AAE0HVG6_9PEZI|nr:hypothetical protein B0H66DRAFT_522770 [Apodospora peruviana]
MATKHQDRDNDPPFTQFACIGSGFSAIALGATLKRWYGITSIRFFEKEADLGGTWFVNKYPGCACDIPSALYSFSFERNPDWSRFLPPADELHAYLRRVANKYDLIDKMSFGKEVTRAEWVEDRARWRLTVRDGTTREEEVVECQFLFSGAGQFTQPRELDDHIKGKETFEGVMVHSARWPKGDDDRISFLRDKSVVVIGNGCTAAQIVPSIVGEVKQLTQVARSKHWIYPPVDDKVASWEKWLLRHSPGLTALQRFMSYSVAEKDWKGFRMDRTGERFRRSKRRMVEAYMRSKAPEKYHDLLVPDFEIGCKRRIFDSGYLASLHAKNLTLTNKQVVEILPRGVRLESGEVVEADAIILATGFATNNSYIGGIEIVGRGGETVRDHFDSFGGPEAYNLTALSGFPNFFLLLGPNTATGHTSTVMIIENAVNYALRVIKPVLQGQASVAEIKRPAEEVYVDQLQKALAKTVWATGCSSWYVRGEAGKTWNGMSYPWSQAWYWWSCLLPVWDHWQFRVSFFLVMYSILLLC